MKTKKVMATVLSAVTALSMAGGMATTVKADDVTEITFPTSWVGVVLIQNGSRIVWKLLMRSTVTVSRSMWKKSQVIRTMWIS